MGDWYDFEEEPVVPFTDVTTLTGRQLEQALYDVDEERCTDPGYWAEVAGNIDAQYAEHTEHLNAETIGGIQQLLQARAS